MCVINEPFIISSSIIKSDSPEARFYRNVNIEEVW